LTRVYNFSAGPGCLPLECLEQAQREMLDWRGLGYSILESSHREPAYVETQQRVVDLLRALLAVPDHYEILLLQGGAHLQFAMIPLNLGRPGAPVECIDTGVWSAKAIEEARRYGAVRVVASSAADGYRSVPQAAALRLDPAAAYVHYCSNETINGVEFPYVPDAGAVPLVADMSSHFLSRPIDVARFGLIYAGAQKNFGPAGLCAVIVRADLVGRAGPQVPAMLDYRTHAAAGSSYNTPPTFSVYFAGLVLEWLQRQGGVAGIEQRNIAKARLLYRTIDESGGFYANRVDPLARSRMNVPFSLRDARLDAPFLADAQARGLVQLRGHRTVGGMRASLYNAMPLEGVQALAAFMQEFARRHG